MKETQCCAVIGQSPMRFPWGFDEEDDGCKALKLDLMQKIMELRVQGVSRFAIVADFGIGLYAGEIINILRETDSDLMLFVVTPHEEWATKWAPYLRDRYFDLLIKCSIMETVSPRKTPDCEREAYRKILDYSDMVLAVYDPDTARGDAVDYAMEYALQRGLPVTLLTSGED